MATALTAANWDTWGTGAPDVDGLWAAYHHIAKLSELGGDERGNTWNQATWGRSSDNAGVQQIGRFVPPDELCGTGMCFAGWYCCLKGVQMDGHGAVMEPVAGRMRVYHYAVAAAGLRGNPWVSALFAAYNDVEGIGEVLVQITGEDRR
jgi:hypothetical protein